MLKINARNLIYTHLSIIMCARTLTEIIPGLFFLDFLPDLITMFLLFFAIHKLRFIGDKNIKNLVYYVVFLVVVDIIMYFAVGENLLLFLWGVRNQYRFIVFLMSCAILLDYNDIPKIFNFLYKWLIINIIVISIQFPMGYSRDALGGTFGTDNNCTGIANIFLVIMISYAIFGILCKSVPTKKIVVIILGSMYWSALAEIKIFFVECVLIAGISLFILKGKTIKKLYLVIALAIFMWIGIELLKVIFPDQAHVFSINGMIDYMVNVNVGAYGFGRLSAIPITTEVFFNNDIIKILFGIGVGNAEFISFGSYYLQSNFYKEYYLYAYNGYAHSMIYIERGLLGLIWYVFLFLNSVKVALKIKANDKETMTYKYAFIAINICLMLSLFYGGGIKVSSGGYLAYLMVAMSYMLLKKRNECK